MKFLLIGLLLFAGCAKERSLQATVTAVDGVNGKDGVSCSVSQQEGGATIMCSDSTSVFISNGSNGTDAENCQVEEVEYGAVITCPDSQVAIYNGTDGEDGQDGQDGQDGEDSTAAIKDYSASSCTAITGTSSYVKKYGSNYALYSSSTCHSNTKYAEISQGEAYFASQKTMMVHAGNVVRAITFN